MGQTSTSSTVQSYTVWTNKEENTWGYQQHKYNMDNGYIYTCFTRKDMHIDNVTFMSCCCKTRQPTGDPKINFALKSSVSAVDVNASARVLHVAGHHTSHLTQDRLPQSSQKRPRAQIIPVKAQLISFLVCSLHFIVRARAKVRL